MTLWEVRNFLNVRQVFVLVVAIPIGPGRRLLNRRMASSLDVREREVAPRMGFEEGIQSR